MNKQAEKSEIANVVAAINLLRAVHRHYSQLSSMADFKANVIVGVTLIALANFTLRYDLVFTTPSLMVLAFFLFTSLLFALMALIPNLWFYKVHPEMPVDYLFFPNFIHMPFSKFEDTITKMLVNDEKMIRAMLIEIYDLGMYLSQKKFRYTHLSYQMLFIGIIATIVTFLIQLILKHL